MWQAELTFIHFFQIHEIVIPDIQKRISDISKTSLDVCNSEEFFQISKK